MAPRAPPPIVVDVISSPLDIQFVLLPFDDSGLTHPAASPIVSAQLGVKKKTCAIVSRTLSTHDLDRVVKEMNTAS